MLDLHGPGYITEVVLIVVCVCCVLCVQRHCTLYKRPHYYSLNDDHTRYTTWRSLFSMVLFVAEKSPQNAAPTREVRVFLVVVVSIQRPRRTPHAAQALTSVACDASGDERRQAF